MKKIYFYMFIILVTLSFSSCAKILSELSTIYVSDKQLNKTLSSIFPISKDYTIAKVDITKGSVKITNENTIEIVSNMDFKVPFFNKQNISFVIAGSPLFDKKNKKIFLQNIEIKKLTVLNNSIEEKVLLNVFSLLSPYLNELFKLKAIYEIPKDTFKRKFLKAIKIVDNKIAISYGI